MRRYPAGDAGREYARCKGCGGVAPRSPDGYLPGWYGLSVGIPPGLSGEGRTYLWVGVWCSVACLETSITDLAGQEQLAHEAYSPVRPVIPR
jgi:hypothetical protein